MTLNAKAGIPMPSEAEMREALRTRDRTADGRFVYGVITTGVYCRPSCASRPAKPENVRFFATAHDAESAGFRSCKRCRPDASGDTESERVIGVARYIEAHADESLPLSRLARLAGLSVAHFQRTFKQAMGASPKAYQDAARMKRLKERLRSGAPVTRAVVDARFQSASRAHEATKRSLGMTPSAYRAGGAGEEIVHACRETSLGSLMLAATRRGVCFAQFGRSEAELLAELRREFPRASLLPSDVRESPRLDDWIRALDAHVSAGAPRPDLPIDLRGTAFQIRVWRFLLQVREGDAVSYSEVAAAVGVPGAARAAASACAANRIAVLVPCHRVLRGDGGLGGYRWGLDRKRALLAQERARGVDATRS
jgi:AraC family transcriptional regulator of adaptative response/methylated-DNA-[protein]-cysteine methyltransferase